MVNSSYPFYKNNVPFEYPQRFKGTWSVGVVPTITAEPITGHILFIKKIGFLMSQDFELSTGTMRMKHSSADGTNKYFQFDYATANEFLASCQVTGLFAHPTGTNEIAGGMCFDPPIKLRKSESESFTIADEGGVVVAGSITLVLNGWSMLETEYDEAE